MHLFLLQVQSLSNGNTRGVSVWVNDRDREQARSRAITALAEIGWSLTHINGEMETGADDYFRACPSQQAFYRAHAEGIAWRFDDE